MHELKIPDTIINAINEGRHAMDLQIVFNGSQWKFSDEWGKSKLSDFITGKIILIECLSTDEVNSHYGVGYVKQSIYNGELLSIEVTPICDLSVRNSEGEYSKIGFIGIYPEGSVFMSDYIDNDIIGLTDDTINIYKL